MSRARTTAKRRRLACGEACDSDDWPQKMKKLNLTYVGARRALPSRIYALAADLYMFLDFLRPTLRIRFFSVNIAPFVVNSYSKNESHHG